MRLQQCVRQFVDCRISHQAKTQPAWLLAMLGLGASVIIGCNRAEPEKLETTQSQAAVAEPTTGVAAEQPRMVNPPGVPPVSNGGVATDSPKTPPILPGNSDGGANNAKPAPINSGVQIEMTTPSLPTDGAASPGNEYQHLADRAFMRLKLPDTSTAPLLLEFFGVCDQAIQELAITLRSQQIDEAGFKEQAKRLSRLKLEGAERLLALTNLSPAETKSGMAAQVESLSHLTSLGDVEAAQKLQRLAEVLSQSQDPQLAHQGKLVTLGFQLNRLQEGQLKDPNVLLAGIDPLFQRPEDRGLVEMMALQQCAGVLAALGYEAEAKQVQTRIVKEYLDSPDAQLSMRAWAMETEATPQFQAFRDAVQAQLQGATQDPQLLSRAAEDLLKAYPNSNTLWQVANSIIPLEFSSHMAAASDIARVVAQFRSQVKPGPLANEVDAFVQNHQRRLAAVGQPVALTELKTFAGQPFDSGQLQGKVTLVVFWASWELNSLDEINKLKELRQKIASSDFQIVAINLDQATMNNAEQMVAKQNYPWINLRGAGEVAAGFETPIAKALGVNAVPFVMLVGRDGRVVAIHTRGPAAVQTINEQLAKN